MLNIQGDSHSPDNNIQKMYYKVINHKLHFHELILFKLTLIFF